MCIIAICKSRKLTPRELTTCWRNNDDGAGFAFPLPDGSTHLRKGFMSVADLRDAYATLDTLPHVVHFRIGSSGARSPQLTHPFVCRADAPVPLRTKTTDPVLFHNGVAWRWEDTAKDLGLSIDKTAWSDTRVIASAVAAYGPSYLETQTGKFVLMHEGKIWMYGAFEEDDGILFSNATYKGFVANYMHLPYRVLVGKTWERYEWNIAKQEYERVDPSAEPPTEPPTETLHVVPSRNTLYKAPRTSYEGSRFYTACKHAYTCTARGSLTWCSMDCQAFELWCAPNVEFSV